jgi:hypothetical protein
MIRRAVLPAGVAVLAGVILAPVVPAQAAAVLSISGTAILHEPPHVADLLPGYFGDDEITRVDYPAAVFGMDRSIAVATAAVLAGVDAAADAVVISGFSQGAIALVYTKQSVMARPSGQRPQADQVSFVSVGDPTGPGGIMRYLPFRVPVLGLSPVRVPETPYDSVVVNGEYDGWADFPDRPWNLISVANALLGTIYVHGRYETVPGGLNLAAVPPANIVTTVNSLGGSTTSYLIPTERLPLVQPLRDIGVPEQIVTAVEAPLKKIVDAGYSRNDAAADPVTVAVAADPITAAAVTAPPARGATLPGADAGPPASRRDTPARSAAARPTAREDRPARPTRAGRPAA